ncbi:hypothetical protein PsorP6_012979 [Peronosclerospora sorghi]|uniref:Uncharacterized protein n=1 Tax=Peronosclerospora sorghi TaxID=230839 RepID=A0ACC0WFN2_9STRA|nr:hypothetical protein PsorP6_012979 [Peronosclerospora sorghi]
MHQKYDIGAVYGGLALSDLSAGSLSGLVTSSPSPLRVRYDALYAYLSGSGSFMVSTLPPTSLARNNGNGKQAFALEEEVRQLCEQEQTKHTVLLKQRLRSMNIGRKRRKRFIYNWTKGGSQLRIRVNREKPVDLMANILLLVSAKHGEDDDDCFKKEIGSIRLKHRRPHAIVDVLSMDELTELQEDVCTYKELEESGNGGQNTEFWSLMRVICDDRMRRLRFAQREGRAERRAIHDSVNKRLKACSRARIETNSSNSKAK